MPKQLGSTVTFTFLLVAIAVAANRAEENSGQRARGPASINHKESVLGEVHASPLRHTAKLHGPLETRIEAVGAGPAAPGDVFVLKGVLTSSSPLATVEYRWSLPSGVELVSGDASGVVSDLAEDRPFELQIKLRARDAKNAQVHLLASARARGVRFADGAQYNTTMEAAFKQSREQLSKSTMENLPDASAKSLRVIH